MRRRHVLWLAWLPAAARGERAERAERDPCGSGVWIDLRCQHPGNAEVTHDARVHVEAPAFAEGPTNVPVSVRVDPALGPVQRIVARVDRNPTTLHARIGRWLQSLGRQATAWAAQGWEMNDVIRGPVPAEFLRWAAFDTEYLRNVAQLYPAYERRALAGR